MSYRAIALHVFPEIQTLAEKILMPEKMAEACLVSQCLLKRGDKRKWAKQKQRLRLDWSHLALGGDFPYVRENGGIISCCSDGMRPVVFKLERL